VSESDILGPIDYLSDFENLVSFERAVFEDYSFKYKIKLFLLFMSISPLKNICPEHHERCTWHIKGRGIFICIFGVLLMG